MNADGGLRPETEVVAECRAATRRFTSRGETVLALEAVDFAATSGTLVAVSGPSGSGKSTLLALLGCLDRATEGVVEVLGRDVTVLGRSARRAIRRSTAATMLAEPTENLFIRRTGVDNLKIAARQRGADVRALHDVIELLQIQRFVTRQCALMSGGEQQRVALGCSLIGGTALLLADEPTAALDAVSAADVIRALAAAAGTGTAVVVATHDANVADVADTVVRLDHGRRVA